jgi:hypothetical protein
LAPLNHTDDARVITTGIRRQNPEKVAETSSSEVSPLNRSRFHTVCLIYATGSYGWEAVIRSSRLNDPSAPIAVVRN